MLGRLINIATLFSIIIASVGLFSLTAFSVIRKQKEIGVRKVYGATRGELLILLNREYWILLSLASASGFPIAYFIISKWLDSYAYHINIRPVYFLITFLSVFIIATLTISLSTLRASNLNPVKTLRDE